MLARSALYLQTKPGARAALIEAFRRLDVPGRALQQEGCLSKELQAPPEEDGPLLVTALWTHRAAYDGWLANPWRAEATAAIAPLVAEEPRGPVYDVLLAAGDAGAAGRAGGPDPSSDDLSRIPSKEERRS